MRVRKLIFTAVVLFSTMGFAQNQKKNTGSADSLTFREVPFFRLILLK